MDDSARGIATASFTLQSSLLQALVRKGVLTPADALDIVDNSLRTAANQPDTEANRDCQPDISCSAGRGASHSGRRCPITSTADYSEARSSLWRSTGMTKTTCTLSHSELF